MNHPTNKKYDIAIIGGGFFGVSLALFLSTVSKNIILIEKEDSILKRGSKNNQARVHTGFHYPRSAVTAVKSMMLHKRFEEDFPNTIVDNFKMLYAISKQHSKVSSQRFWRMFRDMGAPIKKTKLASDLFNRSNIDEIFECRESAFDYTALKDDLNKRIIHSGIKTIFNNEVEKIIEGSLVSKILLKNKDTISSKYIFNITYGNINNLLTNSEMDNIEIKNELVEISFIKPPDEINELGITVMDGPFFSIMPFPSRKNHSFSHVKYSPHMTWAPNNHSDTPYNRPEDYIKKSNYKYMLKDASRFIPSIAESIYEGSVYEIKSVLVRNEINDARPILFHQNKPLSKVVSVLGGKIDNIYDLFEIIKTTFPEFQKANTELLAGK